MPKRRKSDPQSGEISSRPGHLVRRLQQISIALFMEETKGFDITSVQYAALRAIQAVRGIDNTRLVDIVAVDRTTISSVVERLEAKGLIRRVQADWDRRAKLLYSTPAGDALLATIRAAVDRSQERLLAPLSKSKRRQFMSMLAELVHLNNEFSRVPLRVVDKPSPGRPARGGNHRRSKAG